MEELDAEQQAFLPSIPEWMEPVGREHDAPAGHPDHDCTGEYEEDPDDDLGFVMP